MKWRRFEGDDELPADAPRAQLRDARGLIYLDATLAHLEWYRDQPGRPLLLFGHRPVAAGALTLYMPRPRTRSAWREWQRWRAVCRAAGAGVDVRFEESFA